VWLVIFALFALATARAVAFDQPSSSGEVCITFLPPGAPPTLVAGAAEEERHLKSSFAQAVEWADSTKPAVNACTKEATIITVQQLYLKSIATNQPSFVLNAWIMHGSVQSAAFHEESVLKNDADLPVILDRLTTRISLDIAYWLRNHKKF
jgi:hypothetical protein